jgi:hypothetical protein
MLIAGCGRHPHQREGRSDRMRQPTMAEVRLDELTTWEAAPHRPNSGINPKSLRSGSASHTTPIGRDKCLTELLDAANVNRRGLLKCMAWAGSESSGV